MLRFVPVLFVALLSPRFARADDLDPLYTCSPRAATQKVSVQFGPQTSIQELVTWVMGFTCKNVIIDGEVLKRVPTVTILAPQLMTPKQALQLFFDALQAADLAVVVKKDTIIIKLGPKLPRTCPSLAAVPSQTGGTLQLGETP